MEKPLSVKREDFAAGLVGLINACGLPPFVVHDILTKVCGEVERLAAEQLAADKAAWEEANKEAANDGTDNTI